MRGFHSKIELLSADGQLIRRIPGQLAEAMVAGGTAEVAQANGRVKQVRLITSASTHAERIGPPTGTWGGVKFYRRVNLDCGARIVEHHPRCWDYQ